MKESGNYPPGAEFDPNAPWNAPDPIDCPHCVGTGTVVDEDDETDALLTCSDCDGTGVIEVDEHDLKADRADYDRDQRIDDELTGDL